MKTVVDTENWVTYQYWPTNPAVMDFKVYEISQMGGDAPEYHSKGAICGSDSTPDLAKAEALFSGHIKFDGCIDVIFDDQENCMPHFCGNPADKFKLIFDQLYLFAAELMPEHREWILDK